MKKTAAQFIKIALIFCGVFVAGVFLDEFIRRTQKVSIPTDSSAIPEVTISASRKPDFMWIGNAWWIDYESPIPFDLDIGTGMTVKVPAGTHKIFSNHDHNNLDDYGLTYPGDFPETIIAQPTKP